MGRARQIPHAVTIITTEMKLRPSAKPVVSISRMDLNLLLVLDAIYSEGSITRASETLHLTQSAMSHALSRLRELLDDPLFVRVGNRMTPTSRTNEIIAPVRRALNEIEGAFKKLNQFDPQESAREFRIGLRNIVESTTIPGLAARVAEAGPAVKLTSVRYDRENSHSMLASGGLDIVIDVLQPKADGIRHRLLMTTTMVVVVRQGHPVVTNGIDLPTYLELDHVQASSRHSDPGVEDLALHRLGHERHVKLRCQNFSTACEVVARTDMILTMYERYAQALNAPLANRIFPLPYEIPSRELYLYWHASAECEPANMWLRDQVAATYQVF